MAAPRWPGTSREQWPVGLLCSGLFFSQTLFWRTMWTTRACWEDRAVLPPSPGNRKKQEGAVMKYERRQRQKSAVVFSESPAYGGHKRPSVLRFGCPHCHSMNNNTVRLIWHYWSRSCSSSPSSSSYSTLRSLSQGWPRGQQCTP